MVTLQLLDYIRQNIAAGIAHTDIEKALLSAGWAAQDVADGFVAIEKPVPMVTPSVQPPVAQQTSGVSVTTLDNAAEEARILHELVVEAKHKKFQGATASTPVVGGVIGWLILHNVVERESQANIALIGVAVIALVIAGGVLLLGKNTTSKPTPTPQELEAMQRPPLSPENAAISPK